MSNNNVLYIVEDNNLTRKNICELLSILKIKIYDFSDGDSFLKSYEGGKGVLLVDLRLPGISGLKLFKEMNKKYNNKFPLKTIFISGHGDIETAVECLQQGAINFLTKPFKSQNLIDTVHNAFNISSKSKVGNENGILARIVSKNTSISKREKDVLREIILGLSSKEIAINLKISVNTVEVHRAKIIKKTNSKSISHLLAKHRI